MMPLFNAVGKRSLHSNKLVKTIWFFFRGKKVYASLHKQDCAVFIFKNTPLNTFYIPHKYKIWTDLTKFKVKNMRSSFKQRFEVISKCSEDIDQKLSAMYSIKHSKTRNVQSEMVSAAWEILHSFMPKEKYEQSPHQSHQFHNGQYKSPQSNKCNTWILDIGCGDGHSIRPLVSLADPCTCIGVDISISSLHQCKSNIYESVASLDTYCETSSHIKGLRPDNNSLSENDHVENISDKCSFKIYSATDFVTVDIKHGLPFKSGSFDIAVSISFLQWLCFGNRPIQLKNFFIELKRVLKPRGRAILQFYPANLQHLMDVIDQASLHFNGAMVVDYPHLNRGRKIFILLYQK